MNSGTVGEQLEVGDHRSDEDEVDRPVADHLIRQTEFATWRVGRVRHGASVLGELGRVVECHQLADTREQRVLQDPVTADQRCENSDQEQCTDAGERMRMTYFWSIPAMTCFIFW
ncbi:hypothetical protein GCM10022238_33090 [Gordonia hankookensis]